MRSTSLGVLRFQLFSSQVDFWPTSVLQSKYRVYPTVVTCAGADRKRKAVFDEKRLCVEVSCQQTQQIHASSTVAARLDRRLTKFALPGLSQLDNRRDFSNEIEDFVRSFVSFTRPHTILGTLVHEAPWNLHFHIHRRSDQRCFHELDGFIFGVAIILAFHKTCMAGVCGCTLFCWTNLSRFIGGALCFDHECGDCWTESSIW